MAASNSDTALQVNFKLKDGTLVNVYAKTNTEFKKITANATQYPLIA